MAKKKSKAKMRLSSLICLILGVLMVVCVFLPFVSIKAEQSNIITGSSSSTTNYEGHEFIAGMFQDENKDDAEIASLIAYKKGEDTKAGTIMVMIGVLVAGVASLGVVAMGLLNLLLPNGLFNLILKLCAVVAFVMALLAMIGGFVLAGNLVDAGFNIGSIVSAKVSASIGWASIVMAVLGLFTAVTPFVLKK